MNAKLIIDSVVNPFTNEPEAMKLRLKSMMSYEGYLEYYKAYANWTKQKGEIPEEPMTRQFFNSQLRNIPSDLKREIVRRAFDLKVEVPKGFLTVELN